MDIYDFVCADLARTGAGALCAVAASVVIMVILASKYMERMEVPIRDVMFFWPDTFRNTY